MLRIALLGALALGLISAARAQDVHARCVDVSLPKAEIAEKNGRWVAVTAEQYHFLQGIYARNPTTPPGLPYGDGAVLATAPGGDGGMILFVTATRPHADARAA